MILTQDEVKVEGSLGGEKIVMSLDQNSLAHLMAVLTNLYSDPELAVIREISVNALDATREAGRDNPIEVWTPQGLSSNFRVKDTGIGADREDIIKIWSLYGASTKRDSNTQVGMLGLGAKSPLTYTNQFFIIGTKNGIRTHVSVAKNEDGSSTMEIVDESATSDPNGVEVIVPAKRYNSFHDKAVRFFRFWPSGTIKLNGVLLENTLRNLKENIYESPEDTDYIVMGNIAYPCDKPLLARKNSYGYNYRHYVAYVGIGEVAFVPSREALHYTTQTEATIAELQKKVGEVVQAEMIAKIDLCATHMDAWATYLDLTSTFHSYDLVVPNSYKGQVIPVQGVSLNHQFWQPGRRASDFSYGQNTFSPMKGQARFIVLGLPKNSLSGWDTKKINKFFDDKGLTPRLMFCDSDPTDIWLAGMRRFQWDDIRATKLPSVPRGVSTGKVKVMDNGYVLEIDRKDLPPTGTYINVADVKKNSVRIFYRAFPDETIVVLYAKDKPGFYKKYPGYASMSKRATEAWKSVTIPDDHDSFEFEFVKTARRQGTKVLDPVIQAAIDTWVLDKSRDSEYDRLVSLANHFGLKTSGAKTRLNMKASYPLVPSYAGGREFDNTLNYINALYRYNNPKENSNEV